jgi:hypothetical protein
MRGSGEWTSGGVIRLRLHHSRNDLAADLGKKGSPLDYAA